MKISPLIDTDYRSIDIEEEILEVSERLKEVRYLVPIDRNMQAVGIVTIDDVHRHPYGKIIDCDIAKPNTKPDDTLIYVMEMMKKDNLHYLPVFDQYKFVGVISLAKIAQRLAEHLENAQILYQKVIHDIRNPIANIKGLSQLMIKSKSEEENRCFLPTGHQHIR
jgi:predicted transcriptional regulator